MRTAATFAMLAAISGTGAGSAAAGPPPAKTLPFIAGLIAALAAASDDAAVEAALAHPPAGIAVLASDHGGWFVTFPALDARDLVTAWHWADAYAVSGDVHQHSFAVRLRTGPAAPGRIATVDPVVGAWVVRAHLVARPAGELPTLVAGASPAYDLARYTAQLDQIEISRAPRPHAATITRLRALATPVTFAAVTAVLGRPELDIGSGIYMLSYALDDGDAVIVGTADKQTVMYIHLQSGRSLN